MTTIATKSRTALFITLAATAGLRGFAYAEATSSGGVEAVIAAPSIAEMAAASEAGTRYSLPWQLRPVTIGNLARVDGVAAVFNDANGNLDEAVATVVSASYRINRQWAPTIRLAFVGNDAPGEATDGSSFANPLVGATYARPLGSSYRLALFGATTLPIGTGGGDAPNIRAAKTNAASSTARPSDDAMFAVNYTTAIAGADVAFVRYGFTAQAEASLLQFVRVRGGEGGATDPFRTQAAVGLHLGYFIGSHFSLSGDLHHRRWVSHPSTLNAATGARVALLDANMAATTVTVGPRLHFRIGKQGWIRPGISFVRGLDTRGFDAPLLTAQATGVQVDVPVTF